MEIFTGTYPYDKILLAVYGNVKDEYITGG
jgi:hypothetical protein